jgi:two-component system chemotaxis response regulator CheB
MSPTANRVRHHRDIIAIGASTGALDALGALVEKLPGDLPASLFIAVHTLPTTRSSLPALLSARGPLPASHPVHGESIARGRIYVAPPDNHLLLRAGTIEVVRGPKESGHRPSVDALFRTASRAYGPRVIGVVLTGQLDCGAAGLLSIKTRRGLALVQDPEEAIAPEMPRAALRYAEIDAVLPIARIGPRLAELVREPVATDPVEVSDELRVLEGDLRGAPVEISCPNCQGVLTEADIAGLHHFRCHVGHTFTLDGAISEQTEEVERALWAAARALEQSAALASRVAHSARGDMRERLEEKARTQLAQADIIRRIVLGL